MPLAADEMLHRIEDDLMENARHIAELKIRLLEPNIREEKTANLKAVLFLLHSRRTALEQESRAMFAVLGARQALERPLSWATPLSTGSKADAAQGTAQPY